jgi:hypothetical protein
LERADVTDPTFPVEPDIPTLLRVFKELERTALWARPEAETHLLLPHDTFLTWREMSRERTADTSPCDKRSGALGFRVSKPQFTKNTAESGRPKKCQ